MALSGTLSAALSVVDEALVNIAPSIESEIATISDFTYDSVAVAHETTDQALDLGVLTSAKYIYLVSTKPIGVKFAGVGGSEIRGTIFLLSLSTAVTDVRLSNYGTTAADDAVVSVLVAA